MLAAIMDRPANVGYADLLAHDGRLEIVALVALAAAGAVALVVFVARRRRAAA